MYELMKTAISAGGYKLTEILYKIKKLYVLGDLTEAQMDELLALASGGVSADAERPETLAIVKSVADSLKALAARVTALEGESGQQPQYPEWKSWDGISNDYQEGAVVSHNGQLWQSIFAGQNVWEPGTSGTEGMWVKYTTE